MSLSVSWLVLKRKSVYTPPFSLRALQCATLFTLKAAILLYYAGHTPFILRAAHTPLILQVIPSF